MKRGFNFLYIIFPFPLMPVLFLDIQRSFKCRTIFNSCLLVYVVHMLSEHTEIITLAD